MAELACPLLVVSDGARGAAIEQVFPAALRQRCLIHRLRNVLASPPAGMQSEIRDGYWAVFTSMTPKPDPACGWWNGPRSADRVRCPLRRNLPGSD